MIHWILAWSTLIVIGCVAYGIYRHKAKTRQRYYQEFVKRLKQDTSRGSGFIGRQD